jgi:hypothetical protein
MQRQWNHRHPDTLLVGRKDIQFGSNNTQTQARSSTNAQWNTHPRGRATQKDKLEIKRGKYCESRLCFQIRFRRYLSMCCIDRVVVLTTRLYWRFCRKIQSVAPRGATDCILPQNLQYNLNAVVWFVV